MADARLEIEEALEGSREVPAVVAAAASPGGARLLWIVAGTALATLVTGWAAMAWIRPAPTAPPLIKFEIHPPELGTFGHIPAVSPDV